MKISNATSVSIHVYEDEIRFRFFDDVWEDDADGNLLHEEEVARITIPREKIGRTGHGNEIAVYTGQTNEAFDFTDWFSNAVPLPEGHDTLLHLARP